MKTADRPHRITIWLSLGALLLSLGAIVVGLFSLQQSYTAQRVSRATSRAMLIFKSADLAGYGITLSQKAPSATQEDDTHPKKAVYLLIAFQVENVGKAIAHNPTLRYGLDLMPVGPPGTGVTHTGWIKFMDDPPGTPVTAVARMEVPYDEREIKNTPVGLTVRYKLSYDDEATGTHFDERGSCVETVAEQGKTASFHPCF